MNHVEQVLDRCAPAFYRYFWIRAGGHEDVVDDLMQQLWVQVRLKGGRFRIGKAEPWLWRVAQNLLRLHWRTHNRRVEHRPSADPQLARHLADQFGTEEIPPDTIARREVRQQVLLALTELSSGHQELLVARYFEHLSLSALGERLGMSERAVEGRLYRARKALGERLAHLHDEGDRS